MNKKDLSYFTEKLKREKTLLEEELATISCVNPNNSKERDATTTDIEVDSADENEVADKMEELEENKAILGQLEPQLNSVNAALKRIAEGTYGVCDTCSKSIEKERLEANPSATTCIGDMKK